MNYDTFITLITQKSQEISSTLSMKGLKFDSCYTIFPPSVFGPLWMPLLESQGISSALPLITKSVNRFLMKANRNQANSEQKKCQFDHIISVIFSSILTYKSQNITSQEIINRAKQMKKTWKIGPNICSHIIYALQCGDEKENDPESKKLKIINDLLVMFDTNESKLDYKNIALYVLRQTVGEFVYSLDNQKHSYDEIFVRLSISNRQKIIYLLSKIKKKEQTLASILDAIVSPSNNQTEFNQKINICSIFLLAEIWEKFKEVDSKLKDPRVIQILGEAFERIFYLAYSDNQDIGILLLNFLLVSNFTLFDEIKQAIAYHLFAIYKFFICSHKNAAAKLVQRVWNERLKGAKILQAYCQYPPPFLNKSQWAQQRCLQQSDTKSVNSMSSKQERMSFRSNRQSRSKQKSLSIKSNTLNNLNKRIKYIEEQLRRCSLERVYLLLEPLKKFYIEFEDRRIDQISRNVVISFLILLIKKIQSKSQYRYDCPLLKKAIYMQSMQLKQRCFVDGIFQYNEKNPSLGLFQCCYMDKSEINFDNFIKFHEKNNYEDTLQTLYNLKALFDDLNSNNLSGTRLQSYQEQLSALQFESKVYQLYKNQFNQSKKIDAKRLLIICKLLLLKSTNITNNLLVNYVYLMLKQDKNHQAAYKKKIESYSKIMNSEISLQKNQQRIKIFLIMGQIFDDFSEQSFKIMDSGIENRYFELLRRKEHASFYYLYYQNYLKMNYLKEALYFLELHCFAHKNQGSLMMKNAINLYQRLNIPFKTYIKSILKQLKIDQPDLQKDQSKKEKKKFKLESIVLKLKNQIDNVVDLANKCDQYNKFQIWVNFYYYYLEFFIKELAAQKESQEINESLRKYAIMVKYTHLKIDMSRQADPVIRYEDLRIILDIIQKLRNDDDRNHFYLYFLQLLEKSNEIQAIQDIYLQNSLKCKKYGQMLEYLRKDLKPNDSNAKMKTYYLCYLLKYHFQRSQFDQCLSMITVLAQRKEKIRNPTQIYHMQLECKYKMMLNYTIEQYISLICKSIKLQSKNDLSKETKEDHFKFYFKIFRMLFNRYNFTNTMHNQIFLEAYFSFIDENKILTQNKEYIEETILYLLRFVAEKFDYSPSSISKSFEKVIMKKFQGKTSYFVPFCTYLIKRISFNMPKNQVIKSILKTILTQNPKECIWTLAFLKNFNFSIKPQKTSRMTPQETNQIQQLAQLYKEVHEILTKQNGLNAEHFNWIDNLVMLALSQTEIKKQKSYAFKQLPIPPELIFMFNKDYYISRMDDLRVLSNGKSAPLQIVFNLTHIKEKHYLTVKVIIKANVGVKKYRMQSNTANFFEEIGMLDPDITYKIIHLSKCLVLIEHRSNCGTVNNILNECLPQLKKIQAIFLNDIAKRRVNNPQEKRLLQIFDNNNKYQNRIRFSEFIYYKTRNIKQWWKKYNNFVRTHARWSYLCYIVGLGDRHCDNILATDEGKLIHIDFQYVLDTGLKLPYPQWVPFRLTSCFIQPLGILGVFGMYFAQMVQTVREFEQKQHSVWKALSHFIGSMDTNVCEQIIQRSKFKNLDVGDEAEGVAKLIYSAMNPELLRLMFDGWRAYL